jgi:hypothetical protein
VVGEGVESLFPVRKRGLFVTGNNDLLSTKLGFLMLRKTGNNGGNNGMVQRVSREHILRFQRYFAEKMTVSILSTLKITNSLFPRVERIDFVTFPYWVLSLFLWKK